MSPMDLRLFSRGLVKTINYTKFKTKENLNISTSQKPKFMRFYILKSLHNIFVGPKDLGAPAHFE